jgi:hypothetical protein
MSTIKRAELVSELKLAHEEASRLDEMITVLQSARVLDDGKMRQLRIEKVVLNKRALRLHEDLRELDSGVAPASEGIVAA